MAGKVVYLMRHGEAASQEKDARLSDRGRLQAECAALRLLDDLWESTDGRVLELSYSPVGRAVETHEVFRAILERHAPSFIRLGASRKEELIQAGGVLGPLMKAGIPYERAVAHWLRHPESVPGREPEKVYTPVCEFVDSVRKGTADVIVGITHEIPIAALLRCRFCRPADACGVRNGEWITLSF